MSRKNNRFVNNLGEVGNFTKNAIESFENGIVKTKDYLEKIKNHK